MTEVLKVRFDRALLRTGAIIDFIWTWPRPFLRSPKVRFLVTELASATSSATKHPTTKAPISAIQNRFIEARPLAFRSLPQCPYVTSQANRFIKQFYPRG